MLRENRVVQVTGTSFADEFGPLGAHVYTTNDNLPYLKGLKAILKDFC